MYQNKIGAYDPTVGRRIVQHKSVQPQIPSAQDRSGRLCDGTLPGERGQEPNPVPQGGSIGWGLENHPLAMAYAPYQYFREIYEPEKALSRGTLFAELDLPFEGYKGGRGC